MNSKAILKLIASKLASMIGGPFVWLWTKVLYYGGQAIYDLLSNWFRKSKRAKVQKEKLDALEKDAKDPKSSDELIGQDYEKYINSNRSP